MTEFEFKCYGISEQDIREKVMQSITAKLSGLEMVVASILSDAQELLEITGGDEAYRDATRKQLNVAKFILSEIMEAKESA